METSPSLPRRGQKVLIHVDTFKMHISMNFLVYYVLSFISASYLIYKVPTLF
jgi:hypothetical protein